MKHPRSITGAGRTIVACVLASPLVALAQPAFASDFYVDPVIGDDSRPAILAQNPATPWRTLGHALGTVQTGHRVVALPGTYAESVQTSYPGVVVQANTPGTVTIQSSPGGSALQVNHPSVVVAGLVFQGGVHGLRAAAADGLVVRDCVSVGAASDGFAVLDTSGVTIEGSRVISAGGAGVLLERTSGAYLRSNLIYENAGWGVEIDNSSPPGLPLSVGNVLAFNTIAFNGSGIDGGGARFVNATGEVRDNIFAHNSPIGLKLEEVAGTSVHHDLLFGNSIPIQPVDYALGVGIVTSDPLFVSPAGPDGIPGGVATWLDDDFSLAQTAAGQPQQSAAVDAGSGTVETRDIAGSTRSDAVADAGVADLGFHEGAGASAGAPPPQAPSGAEYYVDCATGDDGRPKAVAQTPATPWRTIRTAVTKLTPGDVLIVAPGICNEAGTIAVNDPDLTLRSSTAAATIVRAPAGQTTLTLRGDGILLQGFVIEATSQGVLVEPAGGVPIRDVVLRDLTVRPSGASISFNAVQVRNAEAVTIENSVVTGSLQRGMLLRNVQHAYVRNNLVYGNPNEFGIDFDNPAPAPMSTGNVAAFNTVYGNGAGLRFGRTEGEIRDNIASNNAGAGIRVTTGTSWVHHNDAFGNVTNFDLPFGVHASNRTVDPLFVSTATGNFSLSQTAAGQVVDSPLVDTGSDPVTNADIDGSTRSDAVADAGIADLGYHAGASASPSDPGGPGPGIPPTVATVYVNCTTGNNAVTKFQAQNPATPWRTIGRAFAAGGVAAGDTIIVQSSTCAENVEIPAARTDLTIRAETSGNAVIAAPDDIPAMLIRADRVTLAGFVIQSSDEAVRIAKSATAGSTSDVVLRDLLIQMSAGSKNGIFLQNAIRPVIENSIILDADESGIKFATREQTISDAYVHNNLIVGSGEWGILLSPSIETTKVSTGNVVAFNTVVQNGATGANGGIFLDRATGEVRDNIVANNSGKGIRTNRAAVTIHHNNVFDQPDDLDTTDGNVLWANLAVDPAFVNPGAADYHLSHVGVAGQTSNSPLIDAGSGTTTAVDISGSTRTDHVADAGVADLGFHEGAGASTGVPTPAPTPSPTPTPTPQGPVQPGSGPSLYIDPANGNDGNSTGQAMSPSSPWRTLQHALLQANPGDVIRLLPGVYTEQADVNDNALTLVGEGALGEVVIAPPAGMAGVNVEFFTDARIENLVVQGGSQGILAAAANGIRVTGVAVVAPSTVGIQIRDTETAWVDSSIVTGAGSDGILLRRTSGAYVRNNLVYTNGEWGISVDSTGAALSVGNVIAFNTVHRNQDGIRLLNASGEVRDNQITAQIDLGLFMAGPDIFVHHDNFSANGRDRDRDNAFASSIFVWDNYGKNPRYIEPDGLDGLMGGLGWEDDRFELAQLAANDDPPFSMLVDAGSGLVDDLDISGSTRSDRGNDVDEADVGFHYGATPASEPPDPQTPSDEDLVFTYYVDGSTGNDAVTKATAQHPATPWRTISHALQQVEPGATIVVAAGDYLEAVQVQTEGIDLVAEPAGQAVIRPPAGLNAVTVEAPSVTLDGFVLRGGQTGVSAITGSDDLEIRNCIAVNSASDGFRVKPETGAGLINGVIIEDSRAVGSGFSGILLRRVQDATVRNNLLYDNGEWGLSLDNTPVGGDVPPLSAGNLVAENTIAFNQVGNLRLANSVAEVRDNLLTDTPGVGLRIDTDGSLLLHNGFARDGTLLDPDEAIFCQGCEGNRFVEPHYIAPAGADGTLGGNRYGDDDFRLAQQPAGQGQQSEAVDAGSDDAAVLGATGTTATNGAEDSAAIDMGFHYGATDRAKAPPPAPLPEGNLYVDASIGNDARTRAQAQSMATPWRTIARALAGATPGDVILIAPGNYPERLKIEISHLTLRGMGVMGARITPGERTDAVSVRATDVTLENLWIDGARRGIAAATTVDRLAVKDVTITSTRREGISLRRAAHATLDGVTVSGATLGIRASLAADLEIRDGRLYGNRRNGLALSGGDARVRFTTIYGNGKEGVRSSRNALLLRDSIVAANGTYGLRVGGSVPLDVQFVHFHGNPLAISPASVATGQGVAFALNPLLVDPDGPDGVLGGAGWLDDDLSLSQIAGGQPMNSPAVDAGSDLASTLGVSGSTASNSAPDLGQADLGAHR